jgi:hypothetical protein
MKSGRKRAKRQKKTQTVSALKGPNAASNPSPDRSQREVFDLVALLKAEEVEAQRAAYVKTVEDGDEGTQ